MTRDHF